MAVAVIILAAIFLPASPLYASDGRNDDQAECGYWDSENKTRKIPDIYRCLKLNCKALIILFIGFVLFSAEGEILFFCEALIMGGYIICRLAGLQVDNLQLFT